MKTLREIKRQIQSGAMDGTFNKLYGGDPAAHRARYGKAVELFAQKFGEDRQAALFSAPGRTEIGGNHTDHNNGIVMAASVNLDVIAVASPNGEDVIRIKSEGHRMDVISLAELSVSEREKNRSASLVRGIAARMKQLGYPIGGFDAYTTSNVLKGSGLSSSAAFEVLVGVVLCGLFGGSADAVEIAKIGQYAENVYFGKPCGLMDQMASSVGGMIAIDFKDTERPVIRRHPFAFEDGGYKLVIVNTGGTHADLTPDYAAIPQEMKSVARFFGKEVLREVEEERFYTSIAAVRRQTGDRAVLRAFHFFSENRRVRAMETALAKGDLYTFLKTVQESGQSSFMYNQNVYTNSKPQEQGMSVALAVAGRILDGKGAFRVHGGGFAGTIQAFVPKDLLQEFVKEMENVMGKGSCHVLSVRPVGGVAVLP